MMDWTDRHCRVFHRQLTKHALLYTEMVTADAVIHGNRARLLGFCRGACLSGPEKDRVLVRSVWRAEVELLPWKPRFEIAHRRAVPPHDLLSHLWIEEGFGPIYHRALLESGLVSSPEKRAW